MSKQALLVAGPLVLDDLPDASNLLGGGGGYAAMAAAPLAPTQLWTRGGADITPQMRSVLERRRIDLAGVGWNGPTARWSPSGFRAGGDLLPDLAPINPTDLGAVLIIDLPPREGRRALAVVQALPGHATRPVLIAPRPADCGDGWLEECAAAADVVILPAVAAASAEAMGLADPLALAGRLREAGAKCVVLTRGMFGGIVVYQNKATTWPSLPVAVVDSTGVGSAFAGALAGWCAAAGKADFHTVKRGLAVASAVAGTCAQGIGPRKLLSLDAKEYFERFNKLRRAGKF